MILDRLAEELAELAIVEQRPLQDGRNMTMMLGPSKAVLSGELDAHDKPAPAAEAEAAPVADSDGAAAAAETNGGAVADATDAKAPKA